MLRTVDFRQAESDSLTLPEPNPTDSAIAEWIARELPAMKRRVLESDADLWGLLADSRELATAAFRAALSGAHESAGQYLNRAFDMAANEKACKELRLFAEEVERSNETAEYPDEVRDLFDCTAADVELPQ